MITIPVTVTGDHWLNVEQVRTSLALSDPVESVVLDICAEGPSLGRLGVIEIVLKHCQLQGRDPGTVYISRWSNSVESVPFRRVDRHHLSHFFWMSEKYRTQIEPPTHEYQYGMFCGRITHARGAMVYDAWHRLGNRVLFSIMHNPVVPPWEKDSSGVDLEILDQWVSAPDQHAFRRWWKHCPVTSVDNHSVPDQYDTGQNTNRDLLRHYHRFDIEIVMETATLGDCFFPTEKTVRPLLAGKPMIVYGPRGFLANLKRLGFRTWHDSWDESYDDLEGVARWYAMAALLQQDLKADISVAQHNQQNLQDLIKRHRPG